MKYLAKILLIFVFMSKTFASMYEVRIAEAQRKLQTAGIGYGLTYRTPQECETLRKRIRDSKQALREMSSDSEKEEKLKIDSALIPTQSKL